MTVFYERYCELCAAKGESASGVASAIGLSNAAANGWKKGKIPNDTTLAKLSAYFEVSVSYLRGESEQKEKSLTPSGERLSKEQEKAIILIKKMTENQIKAFIAFAEEMLGEQYGDL